MVKTITVKMKQLTCERPACGNVWTIPADKPLPKVCVRCKSRDWNGGRL